MKSTKKCLILWATAALLLGGLSASAAAQQFDEQSPSRGLGIRIDLGFSGNHSGDDQSLGGALRVSFPLDSRDRVRGDAGLKGGAPYIGADVGVEARAPISTRNRLLGRIGVGTLVEDGGLFFNPRVGGGIEFAVGQKLVVRPGFDFSWHGGQGGPYQATVGFEYRLGS